MPEPLSSASAGRRPTVWYVAAGYLLPAGVEAYLLHYATELRRQGFDPRILVFQPLPRDKHRYLRALGERGIPIDSLFAMAAPRARLRAALLWLPWRARAALRRETGRGRSLYAWALKREAVALLGRMIRRERPDVVHVKGRVITEAWPVFPPERTVYQHALMGTVDPSWEAHEVDAFRAFANRIARIFVQGPGIAAVMAPAFGITRPIDTVFTMAPDECGGAGVRECGSGGVSECRGSGAAKECDGRDATAFAASARALRHPHTPTPPHSHTIRRFGIVCRFTEQKGIAYILEALRMYRDRNGDVSFTFAGQGPLEGMIRQFAAQHGLEGVKVVRFEHLAEALGAMDVFVHPGLDDAMPVSLVEALMFGVPCIGSRVGAVPDLVRDGIEGYLIEPASAAQILDAMERFARMTDDDLQSFRRRARARYEEACRPEVVGAIVAGHYRAIIAAAGAPR